MAGWGSQNWGESTWGSGAGITPPVPATLTVSEIVPISKNYVKIVFSIPTRVTSALTDTSNYVITGTPTSTVQRVLVQADEKLVSEVIICFTEPGIGTLYTLTVSNIVDEFNVAIAAPNNSGQWYGRKTKVDSILSSMPSMWNKTDQYLLFYLLGAIGLIDEEIGGTRDDRL